MKRTLSIFLFLLVAGQVYSQKDKAVALVPSVQKATIYPNGAFLECTATKFMAGGKQVVQFTGLPAGVLASSIRISSGQGVTVHSISAEKNHRRQAPTSETFRQLKDSLRTYRFDYRFNQNMLDVYAEERKMILANKEVGWEKGGFVVEDLEDLSDFYRDRLADIMLKEMQIEAKQEKVKRNMERLGAQYAWIDTVPQPTTDVYADVTVSGNGNHVFEVSFFTGYAGWEPVYHIQPKNNGSVLDVAMYASLYQKTGMEWNNIELDFFANGPMNTGNNAHQGSGEFSSKDKISLASDGNPKAIPLSTFDVPVRIVYEITPEDSVPVLRVAMASGNQENLYPGKAMVFQNGFSGAAQIARDAVTGDLRIPLGTDAEIQVDKNLVKQTLKSGRARKETNAYEIIVRSVKKEAVTVVLKDAVKAKTDGTTFKLNEAKDAVFNPDGCTLTWNKTIAPGASAKFIYKYTLTYPAAD